MTSSIVSAICMLSTEGGMDAVLSNSKRDAWKNSRELGHSSKASSMRMKGHV